MIDLHLHTTASDGRCTPEALVDRAAQAGVTVLAVTDHDTTAAIDSVRRAASAHGIRVVTGIEITAVEDGRDVHVLGYFFDPHDSQLGAFLSTQRDARVARVERLAERLASLGMPIDAAAVIADARRSGGKSVGRPHVARAMVAAGYVADMRQAFDRWLGAGCPAFVPRPGTPLPNVVGLIHAAGGLASLAHPGRTLMDDRIGEWRQAGLDALEAYHSDHDADTSSRYRALAEQLGLLITGGSDYHADPSRDVMPGTASLPEADWRRFEAASHVGR